MPLATAGAAAPADPQGTRPRRLRVRTDALPQPPCARATSCRATTLTRRKPLWPAPTQPRRRARPAWPARRRGHASGTGRQAPKACGPIRTTTASVRPVPAAAVRLRLAREAYRRQQGAWERGAVVRPAVSCSALVAYNASFTPVLIGSTAGLCLPGFAGTISSVCLLNVTATGSEPYWTVPTGSCTRTSTH